MNDIEIEGWINEKMEYLRRYFADEAKRTLVETFVSTEKDKDRLIQIRAKLAEMAALQEEEAALVAKGVEVLETI